MADGEACRFARRPELLAAVNEDAALPVNVFGVEIGSVGLSGSGFEKQFVIGPALGVAFSADDFFVFLRCDPALALAADFRPRGFGKDRPCEPAEIDGEVVEPS